MKKSSIYWKPSGLLVGLLVILFQFFFVANSSRDIYGNDKVSSPSSLELKVEDKQVTMSNGLVSVTFSSPEGTILAIKYRGANESILERKNAVNNGGYWDVVWSSSIDVDADDELPDIDDMLVDSAPSSNSDRMDGTNFKIIVQNQDQIEISFSRLWNKKNGAPLNVDKRFIMLSKSSGFYAYGILERKRDFPITRIDQLRIVFKLRGDMFDHMSISDKIQKVMPSGVDRAQGTPLMYKEAVLLKNGGVDDKYEYSQDNIDNRVHGWINRKDKVGFWIITPSNEFRNGGPLKQDLTSHCGPVALSMFVSTHYTGLPLAIHFKNEEEWKKVFGPIFIYLNSNDQIQALWQNAKQQMMSETRSWPYNFPLSPDFAHSDKRGSISGRLDVRNGSKLTHPAASARVGLAAPGDAGSWQTESKLYQFWTEADCEGKFNIKGVLPGKYNLFAWVPGFIGDYKYGPIVTILPGSNIQLDHLTYEPPRAGTTLWEIGYPDRTAAEFFIPESNPLYVNKVDNNFELERYRQYGLWSRYAEIYPKEDLVFTVGKSSYSKDWFFAQVTRNSSGVYKGTTWKIEFGLEKVAKGGNYTLRLAIAGAMTAELQVRVNVMDGSPLFSTGLIGKENLIARHGIHGLYRLYHVSFGGRELRVGKNVIFLTQSRGERPFKGLLYDYIRLEAPPSSSACT